MCLQDRRIGLLVACFVVLAVSVGCQPEPWESDVAQSEWNSRSFDDYSFVYEENGFAPNFYGPVEITVVDDEVFSVAPLNDGVVVEPSAVQNFPTMDDLFQQIREAEVSNVTLTVVYDPELSFPQSASFDSWSEGYGFTVSDVVAYEQAEDE